MFQIIWSDEAEVDYIETLNYWIENNQSDKYALKLMEEVEKKEDLISENPFTGTPSEIENVKSVLVDRNFSIYYKINDDTIEILSFWDNRRNPENLES